MTNISKVLSTAIFSKRKFRKYFQILKQVKKFALGYSRNGRVLGIGLLVHDFILYDLHELSKLEQSINYLQIIYYNTFLIATKLEWAFYTLL